MSCFLPNGVKRPVLDINSDLLIYLWNFPNHLPMTNIRRDVFRRYGFVRFIETFEAWKNKKIGQIILEFVDKKELDSFVDALERKEVLNNFNPPVEFLCLQKMGRKKFFDYIKEWSGVDLISCGGIPPSFAIIAKKSNERQFDNNNGGFGSRRVFGNGRSTISKPFAAEWENCKAAPRLKNKQKQPENLKQNIQENLNNNFKLFSSSSVKETKNNNNKTENEENCEEINITTKKEETTTNNSTFKQQKLATSLNNNYREKPPSLASEDDDGLNIMLIRKIKLGFSIEKILEDLQNFGDIIDYKQLDETTAMFKFLDASEAELAAKIVSKNANLFGSTAIFELQS